MNRVWIRYQRNKLKEYLAVKTGMVNHRDVIREVATGVDRSWVYYLMLLLAALIALFGLLTNSVAVVIGAMLISPLMGPIISSGLALTIGDLPLARRAFRTIAVSVVLTVLVCALITVVSPLKEPTSEILARVRPNIYDLFIAMLSGVVGAVALCTKRNYLITATGVAVATAVIPPLSVAGYGLGTGQIMLGLGGFLLFFTNFVAIVLTSDLVFFIMGFRTSHVETIQYSQRKRLMIIAGLLSLISIPLVHTLVVDVTNVKEKKRIERVLKKHLNIEQKSRMTGYTHQKKKDKVQVRASVNTVSFIDKTVERIMEEELKTGFGLPVDLQLEQVIVASEKLPEQEAAAAVVSMESRMENAAEITTRVGRLLGSVQKELSVSLAPFPLSDLRLGFGGPQQPLRVSADLGRDYPLSEDERLILARRLEQLLGLPVDLKVSIRPFLPSLRFTAQGELAEESVKALAVIRQLPDGVDGYRFLLEQPGRIGDKQSNIVKNYLVNELGVASGLISDGHGKKGNSRRTVVLRIVRK